MVSSSRPAISMRSDDSSSSIPSRHLSNQMPSSFRASPSPSATSQSDDQDRDDEDDEIEEEEEEDDYTDMGTASFSIKERRNTLKAKGSAALPISTPAPNSSETWQMTPANARNASAATLPHEILLHIFKYVAVHPPQLRKALTVCKSWCLCGVELLWHRPSFFRISSLFKMIHIIRQPNQTFPYATFVRRLNLSMLAADLEDTLFGRLAVCTRLERLTLTGCTLISDDVIADVLSHTKHLVAADFSEVLQLTDKSILKIAENCPRLQGINITGCKSITSESVATLARNCKLLRRVKLCGCELVGDKALTALAQSCPVLLEVDLINCPLITDSSVREMWKHSFHMRELRLAQCGKLTDLAFPAPNSSVSGVSAANVVGLGGSASSAGQVTSLEQNNNSYYGGSESAPASRGASPFGGATSHAGASSGLLQQTVSATSQDRFPRTSSIPSHTPMYGHLRTIRMFDHLRILDLTNCSTISDAAIDGIVSNVPRIRNLILAKCTRLTNESVYSIARLGKNLHYLHLGHVSNLTDRAVCHLAQSCTRLRYIDLACCPQLTDLSVLELASNLPKLRRIGLVRVTNLTDNAIFGLVGRYTSLERIHLSYCENVSVPAVFWLLERLSRLTHLSLTGVPAFRKPELQAMCREPPREFNAHQRSAFCVYSGKGVSELRKFLQNAYSGDDPDWELSPDLQRARSYLARVNRGESRTAVSIPVLSPSREGGGEDRRGVHHQVSRSDPQQSSRTYSVRLDTSAPAFDSARPITTESSMGAAILNEPSTSMMAPHASSSSSSRRPTAMQVDNIKTSAGWEAMDEDGREGEDSDEAENDEENSLRALQTPTAAAPSSSFAFRGLTGRNGESKAPPSHNGFAAKRAAQAASASSSSSSAAFTGAGRTLGGGVGGGGGSMHPATLSHSGAPFGSMAALATPPLSSAAGFFHSDMTPTDQNPFGRMPDSMYPRFDQQAAQPSYTANQRNSNNNSTNNTASNSNEASSHLSSSSTPPHSSSS